MGWERSLAESSAYAIGNGDHSKDYDLMHNIESQPTFLERTLDNMNNSIISKCEDVGIAQSLGLGPWDQN